ncbi:MAG: hypothetical protein JJU28_15605 [Cyclobacteriaceae bacterium]|nr:hypothetical protein [Cyclobacteriaceae bacterium]
MAVLSTAFCLPLFFLSVFTCAQTIHNANTKENFYTGSFNFGVNGGYYPGWFDDHIANIAAGNPKLRLPGAGFNSLRPALFAHFLEEWGYDIRVDIFQHYSSLGMQNHAVFIGYPSEQQRSHDSFCENEPSKVFANLYEPIWMEGKQGTEVNKNNHYAWYVYRMVQKYGDYVKFWEVWNEPDFTHSPGAYKRKGEEGNWWDMDPEPCELSNLYAPVQYYIRMLRITYEVVKTLQPDDFVCTGGIGYPSFLDAILRNTDNPDQGKISEEYPEKGGAWFDCLSFHYYPMYDLHRWDNSIAGFRYERHSDAAADGIGRAKGRFEEVLQQYGYDGRNYPEKAWIITECNIPGVQISDKDYIGSDEAQRNFIIKALVQCHKRDISGLYFYQIASTQSRNEARDPFDAMGFFEIMPCSKPYDYNTCNAAWANKTTADFLKNAQYHAAMTGEMLYTEGIDGAVYRDERKERYIAVLWAKTQTDQNESASVSYTLPEHWESNNTRLYEWDYSKTGKDRKLKDRNIELNGSPVFIIWQIKK